MKKKRFLSGIARIPKTPPPPDPNSGNLVLFFSDVKIQDLKVHYIGIFEEIDSFY